MATINISPDAALSPFLKHGGEYGHGRVHEAEVELIKVEFPAEKGPGYDRESKDDKAAPYFYFLFRVDHPEMGSVLVNEWQPSQPGSGSKALQYISSIAPECVDLESGDVDIDSLAPRPCAIEVKGPREGNDGRWWTGNVINVFGV